MHAFAQLAIALVCASALPLGEFYRYPFNCTGQCTLPDPLKLKFKFLGENEEHVDVSVTVTSGHVTITLTVTCYDYNNCILSLHR